MVLALHRFFLLALSAVLSAAAAEIDLVLSSSGPMLAVRGESNQEWRFEQTTDLAHWVPLPGTGTMFSQAAPKLMPTSSDAAERQFFRSVQTVGLFDPHAIRSLYLTFTTTNWRRLLAAGWTNGSNTRCALSLDNGLAFPAVGARYRGNSSFGFARKKSVNISIDEADPEARLMGRRTINLNNAAGDPTLLRELIYFNVMREFAPCPGAALAKLYINDEFWGVYSFVEQENADFIKAWFPSNRGDRWKAPNVEMVPSGGALGWLGTNVLAYQHNYELKTDNSPKAWQRLMRAVEVLNKTPTDQLRDAVEDVLAVDRWLWFLAAENVFADEDSYFWKGADYGLYYEPESGRIHPIEHDGNEAFTDRHLNASPVHVETHGADRPVLSRLLSVPEFRQRYLSHVRTILEERFNPEYLTPLIERFHALAVGDIEADTQKPYTMTTYTNGLVVLKEFVTNRYHFLRGHGELLPKPPRVLSVRVSTPTPAPDEVPAVTATVSAEDQDEIDSVWLYWRDKLYGRFKVVQMLEVFNQGQAGSRAFRAFLTNHPAGTKVSFYVEARSGNPSKAASFAPARAEVMTYDYLVEARGQRWVCGTSEATDFLSRQETEIAEAAAGVWALREEVVPYVQETAGFGR